MRPRAAVEVYLYRDVAHMRKPIDGLAASVNRFITIVTREHHNEEIHLHRAMGCRT